MNDRTTTLVDDPGRVASLDALRGLIMVLMALDHFIYFINRFHPAEFWITAPPIFLSPAFQIFRLLSHLCAPGFVFLAGTSIVLFADRRATSGVPWGRIRGALVIRGLLLVFVIQLVVEQGAWGLGELGGRGVEMNSVVYPGQVSRAPVGYLGVIYVLGVSMMVGVTVLRARDWVLMVAAAVSLVVSPLALSFVQSANSPINPVVNALFVPGVSFLFTNYPLFPWVGVFLLGMLFGRRLARGGRDAIRPLLPAGAGAFAVGVALRFVHPWGESHPFVAARVGSFLDLSKYPPSLAYIGMTLGILAVLLWGFERSGRPGRPLRITGLLQVFGREPLLFYIMHLYGYALVSLVVVLRPSAIYTIVGWAVSLPVYGLALHRYHRLKKAGRITKVLSWI